ncbi:2-amino-4-hydroxy-6-hydroxymethyldihydropteridine diphosphokinase [Acidihalobacter prosperus]|uniref:2-amino-4-hydroxy-6- hydroxymethyldihydropteridine diphosphokinase n=1 Tax=Acidihalobacter prosperus TaxID=160660 RepID=UPI00068BA7CD|nr:2-amino-4-hydroxy-6-hydroxymethyldihydropteridine diphosphokinase [Acidihalobacter prosperus]
MSEGASGYVIGIGSNIEPERNVPRIIDALLRRFGALRMSRILRTRPVDMASERDFLNLAIYAETALTASELKDVCNGIECALGRDRCDPERARKDRVADLDILFALVPGVSAPSLTAVDGVYFRPVVADLYGLLGLSPVAMESPGVPVCLDGASAGEVPAAIHLDRGTGQVVVVEQRP